MNQHNSNYNAPPNYDPNLNSNSNSNYNPPNYGNHQHNNSQGGMSMNIPNHFSLPTTNGIQITSKLHQIDSRIANFAQYICILYFLMILSFMSLFISGLILNNIDLNIMSKDYNELLNLKIFETINFFVILYHIAAYIYGIQAFNKQNSEMNKIVEYLLAGAAVTNIVYFILFIFLYHVTFFTWCLDIFYLVMNALMHLQCKELTPQFKEKETYKKMENVLL
jgi:hypothetical protein